MKKFLHGLYAITNEQLMPADIFLSKAESALSAGIAVLQYRDKSSDTLKRTTQVSLLKQLCDKHNTLLIINDDIELAKEVDADGVHIGKDDQSIHIVREQLGENKIIGVSCYDQIALAESAVKDGADYIAFGSFFNSSVKPDASKANINLIADFKSNYDTPVCCIGGITTENCPPLIAAGADMLAVISDVFSHDSHNEIQNKCREYSSALKL